ncbi:hypothetical protein AHF37_02825 [Paragonimus kellicotti]|nr:hypothetical protein AHF37_02825 [Paragonimus kellicotti]
MHPPFGHAVQIVTVDESNSNTHFSLNESALSSILLHPNVRDKFVVIVSVAGVFRQGKSFLLDFFLRYMSSEDKSNWLGDENMPLAGFPWCGGSRRLTTGILLWSEPFVIRLSSGEEAAVLFMDTQGAFDSLSTVRQCATVFALSTMLSSIQIYNIHGNIQEDHLQHLHLFTEYGRLAMESDVCENPFQHLLFLVRDWSFPYEYEYGSIGGNRLLDSRLKIQPNHQSEHETVRRHIRSCFSRVTCFLLPHPGSKVATSPQFDGRLSDIDRDFVRELSILVPTILSPSSLQLKKINGEKVTCRELVTYFKAYMEIYQGDTLPEPRSMLEATAEANNLNAIMISQELYTEAMNKIQPNHQSEHETVRRHIRSCFSRVTCFLLPHPGSKVATSPQFDGRLSDIDRDFVRELSILVPTILSPSSLQLKKINGEKVTCRELVTYFKALPSSRFTFTVEVCGPDKPYMNPSDLEVAHTRAFTAAVQKFSKTRKMGGAEYSARYLERLQSTLQQLGNEYRVANTNKNIFQTFRTPAVFVVILVIFYLITGISEFIGLSTVTNMFLFPFYMALVTLMTWLFLSYTGRAPELASAIDSAADVMIQKVITPAVQRIGQRSIQQLVGVTDRQQLLLLLADSVYILPFLNLIGHSISG